MHPSLAQPSGVSAQRPIINKVLEGAFYPFIKVTDKNVEQDHTQYWILGK